jgi:hypothetical protein
MNYFTNINTKKAEWMRISLLSREEQLLFPPKNPPSTWMGLGNKMGNNSRMTSFSSNVYSNYKYRTSARV